MIINKLEAHPTNYRRGSINDKKYLVIHWVGASSTAENNAKYFANNPHLSASAHYFVDDKEIYNSVPIDDVAFAVGDGQGKKGITNENSINIEMCCKVATGDEISWAGYTITDKTIINTIELVCKILQCYPDLILARHYDASGKWCPGIFVEYPYQWQQFKKKVEVYLNIMTSSSEWQKNLMIDAITELQKSGVIVSDEWKEKNPIDNTPLWLFWEMLRRIVSRETK